MKEMDSLETQLRCWQPRRPSVGLEQRLFGTPVNLMPKLAWLVGWLVPATACALLTFSVLTSGNGIAGRATGAEPLMATMLSNKSLLLRAPESRWKGQNELSSVTFDWTNGSGSTSSMPSFPRNRMN